MTSTAAAGHPKATARSANAYCRCRLAMFEDLMRRGLTHVYDCQTLQMFVVYLFRSSGVCVRHGRWLVDSLFTAFVEPRLPWVAEQMFVLLIGYLLAAERSAPLCQDPCQLTEQLLSPRLRKLRPKLIQRNDGRRFRGRDRWAQGGNVG